MKVRIRQKSGSKVVDLNRRKAIRERCLNCVAWYSREVTLCKFDGKQGFEACPLHPYRMGTGKQVAKDRKRAIMDYCLWCVCGSPYEVAKCPSIDCPLWAYRNTTTDRSIEVS